jgi:hypothetical protein
MAQVKAMPQFQVDLSKAHRFAFSWIFLKVIIENPGEPR